MDIQEFRTPLGAQEDNNTVYNFTDWTSATKMRNYVDPLLRVDIAVLRYLTEDLNEIEGYQLTVYNVNTQVIVYKFYINYIKDYVYSFTTEQAIQFLNHIGFRCFYEEEIILSERARTILTSLQNMGYTHISRIVGHADYLVTTAANDAEAELTIGKSLREILANTYKYVNLYDFRFIGKLPVNIEKLLR